MSIKALNTLIEKDKYEKAVEYIEENMVEILSTHKLFQTFKLMSEIPEAYYVTNMPVLIYSALSFACGNNMVMTRMIQKIDTDSFQTSSEAVFYYAIKAIGKTSEDIEERLETSRKAIGKIDKNTKPMICAYAHLVHAQLLTASCDYVKAELAYKKSIEMFSQSKAHFLASMTFTNYSILNNLKGKHKKVIRESQKFLNEQGSIFDDFNAYNCMIKMVEGLAFKNIGKLSIASKTLSEAMEDIYNLQLIHMYAYPFFELMECHVLLHANDALKRSINHFKNMTKGLHDTNINMFINYLSILLALESGEIPSRTEIESFEISYTMERESGLTNYLELALNLKQLNLSNIFKVEDLRGHYEKANYMELKMESARCSALFLSWYDSEGYIDEAKAYCLELVEKCLETDNVFLLIKHRSLIRKYLKHIPEKVSKEVLAVYPEIDSDFNKSVMSNPYNLTERELDVLSLISEGLSNKDVAQKLYISVGTVKWHLNNVYGKMNVKSRYEAIVFAQEEGMLKSK